MNVREITKDGRNLPVLLLALFLAFCGIVNMVQQGDRSSGLDFYQLWADAHFVKTDGAAIYQPQNREAIQQKAGLEAARSSSARQRFAASQRLNVNVTPAILSVYGTASSDFEAAYSTYRILAFVAFIAAMLF